MRMGIIYYTDNQIDKSISKRVMASILTGNLPVVSVSLKPLGFGANVVLEGRERSYATMVEQIVKALETSNADYVFFCEHDVMYHPSHFAFQPERDDVYYYNYNNWRWDYPKDRLIKYNELTSLSQLCAHRKTALNHYRMRYSYIKDNRLDEIISQEPKWARVMGYEPGLKKIRRGGLTDEDFEKFHSKYPNIDIRHKGTFSRPKVRKDRFKHPPHNWQEAKLDDIPGWTGRYSLRRIFKGLVN